MRWLGLSFLFALVGCQEAPVRPQLVIHVDVDMPVTSLASDKVSPDALFDSLRVDVLDVDGQPIETRVFSIASAGLLPVSFGVSSEAAPEGVVLVRLRAFRAGFAKNGVLADEEPVLDPRGEVSIDRLVTLDLPSEGVIEKSVRLHGDCMGIPVGFHGGDTPDTTCLDGDHLVADSRDGVTDGAFAETASGSWPLATALSCKEAALRAPAGARCIAGGFSILGDPLFLAHNELELDALPLRPVVLSTFFMDETEVTVGMLRALVRDGYDGPLPAPREPLDSVNRFCTWADDAADDLPLNCITFDVADEICARRGGLTPSEAQWEYAARGRGKRSLFVWDDDLVECCTSSIAYFSEADSGCGPFGPEPVGSHPTTEECVGDVSLDGVLDLNGSMNELVRDSIASYGDACWSSPNESAILHDHVCQAAAGRVGRGGSWFNTLGAASLPIRRGFAELDPGYGFRCVYPYEGSP